MRKKIKLKITSIKTNNIVRENECSDIRHAKRIERSLRQLFPRDKFKYEFITL